MSSSSMKVTVIHVADRDTTISSTFEFFIDTPEEAFQQGVQAAQAFIEFLNGYGSGQEPA